MRVDEILASQKLFEMAYDKKQAEIEIRGLQKPLNNHLLKIWAMPTSQNRNHWIAEVINWCSDITEIVLKPSNRRPKQKFYYNILFDQPFGGAELPNIISRLNSIKRMGNELDPSITPISLLYRLQKFHEDFSKLSAMAQVPEDEVRRLIG